MTIERVRKNKHLLLVTAVFLIIFFSRFLFLSADLPKIHGIDVEIEEKSGGLNARNMVLFDRWPLYRNWYQPMVYMPLQNFISYWTFRLFGVGLAQFRFPSVLAGFLGLIFFYLTLSKQTNRLFALLGVLFYAFIFEVTVWNRSALTENLYLLFMPLSVYFLTKDRLRDRDLFALVFFAALNLVVKVDGYPFFLATIIFLLLWPVSVNFFDRTLKAIVLGSLAALAVLLFLFAFTNCFNYISLMYRFYFGMYGATAENVSFGRMVLSLRELLLYFVRVDPYLLLAFFAALPGLIIGYFRLKRADRFVIVFLLVIAGTRLLIPSYLLSWKRLLPIFLPVCYLTTRSLFLLWKEGEASLRISKTARIALSGLTLSFVLTSLVMNTLKIAKIYLPENVRYSYQENEKYTKLIPKEEMIVSHEQAFRAFAYLSQHQFYYNHDGGPNPISYREVLERKDLRYFILNVEDFWRELWGIPNRVRLELIKEAYPDLKLLGVFPASGVYLAIYDKYGDSL